LIAAAVVGWVLVSAVCEGRCMGSVGGEVGVDVEGVAVVEVEGGQAG